MELVILESKIKDTSTFTKTLQIDVYSYYVHFFYVFQVTMYLETWIVFKFHIL